jgi:hypothetical protein
MSFGPSRADQHMEQQTKDNRLNKEKWKVSRPYKPNKNIGDTILGNEESVR